MPAIVYIKRCLDGSITAKEPSGISFLPRVCSNQSLRGFLTRHLHSEYEEIGPILHGVIGPNFAVEQRNLKRLFVSSSSARNKWVQ